MRRLSRKRLPVLCLGGLVKVAEGFAAANSMIWRQSPMCHTVEHNEGTRPLWVMQRAITQGCIKRHGRRFMLRWDWACVRCKRKARQVRFLPVTISRGVLRFSPRLAGGPKRRETSATCPAALAGWVLTQDQQHGHTITADNRQDARA
jgi:hypothetical protein